MSKTPYVPFYTSDFLGGTSGMTAATRGVYITLLCLMYETEAPLLQKWDILARRCGCTLPAFRRAVQALIDDDKVSDVDGGLWSTKCEKHIAQRCERSESASGAAKRRWQKSEQKQGKPDASASSAQCYPEPEPEPYKEREDLPALAVKKKTGSRLSPSWHLPRDWGEWALSEGWTDAQIRTEADKFRDYWVSKPGRGATKLDWEATWRNWMRNSKAEKGGTDGRVTKGQQRLAAFIAGARGAP